MAASSERIIDAAMARQISHRGACFGDEVVTLPETNVAPENRVSQKESHLSTIHFQGLC